MAKRRNKKSKNMAKGTAPPTRKPPSPIAQTSNQKQTIATPKKKKTSQSLAQKRAKHALDAIQDGNMKNYGKYTSYVSALPANIIMSGLGQALAMLKAGKKDGHGFLFNHMQNWLCSDWKNGPYSGDLLPAIVNGSEDEYTRTQAEAMEYLEWLKKFAVAFLKDGDEKKSGGDDDVATD